MSEKRLRASRDDIDEKEGMEMNYSYRCPHCGVFAVEQSMKDEPLRACPSCSQPVKRIIGKNINVIYRTTGFYSTDASSCAGKGAAAASSGAESPCHTCEHREAHQG